MKYSTIRLTKETILKLRKIQESISETYEETILKLIEYYVRHKKDKEK